MTHIRILADVTPYLDEAKEIGGETSILPGSDVQAEIDEALKGANLLLLIDTPDAMKPTPLPT
jgi:hypothetical protein